MKIILIIVTVIFFSVAGYYWYKKPSQTNLILRDTVKAVTVVHDSVGNDSVKKNIIHDTVPPAKIILGNVHADSIVQFAETLMGTPYLYGSTDPAHGFDCSGFITYVFNHFKITVPRSSIDFTNIGTTIPLTDSRKGDLILFTGTDSTEKFVGHMGIIIANDNGNIQFIHSSSGRKANGVVITTLNDYYKGRFVKVVRID